jgi:hypothetical protein
MTSFVLVRLGRFRILIRMWVPPYRNSDIGENAVGWMANGSLNVNENGTCWCTQSSRRSHGATTAVNVLATFDLKLSVT